MESYINDQVQYYVDVSSVRGTLGRNHVTPSVCLLAAEDSTV